MKVLFIMPLAYSVFQFQVAALSAYLKQQGHEVEYIELLLHGDLTPQAAERIDSRMKAFKPDLVGFSSYEMTMEWIRQIAAHIKKDSDVPIIVGGYLATLAPEFVLKDASIDYVCVGEGEFTMEELLGRLAAGQPALDIPGLYAKQDGEVIVNRPKRLIEDIDALPFSDRRIIDYQEHIGRPDQGRHPILAIMASRGCPFKCSYCSNHALRKVYLDSSKYVRYRKPESVIRELEQCEKDYQFAEISFEDDMFAANIKWLRAFAELYKKRFKYPFRCNLRPEVATPETSKLLREMGCHLVAIGLESGDPRIRKEALGRHMTNKTILTAAGNLKREGIKVRTYNMVGLPGESVMSLLRTIWMNLRIGPWEAQTTLYFPLRGTILGDRCFEQGMVDDEAIRSIKTYAFQAPLKHDRLPKRVIQVAKWLNSFTALRSGNVGLIKPFLVLVRDTLFPRTAA